jgi:DNA-binding NarL/FixJ family response regulator
MISEPLRRGHPLGVTTRSSARGDPVTGFLVLGADGRLLHADRQVAAAVSEVADRLRRRVVTQVRRADGQAMEVRFGDTLRVRLLPVRPDVAEVFGVAALVDDRPALPPALTPREAEVARLLAREWQSQDIAVELGVSVVTARWHAKNVRKKLATGPEGPAASASTPPPPRRGRAQRPAPPAREGPAPRRRARSS